MTSAGNSSTSKAITKPKKLVLKPLIWRTSFPPMRFWSEARCNHYWATRSFYRVRRKRHCLTTRRHSASIKPSLSRMTPTWRRTMQLWGGPIFAWGISRKPISSSAKPWGLLKPLFWASPEMKDSYAGRLKDTLLEYAQVKRAAGQNEAADALEAKANRL